MILAKNWNIKSDNDWHLVLVKDIENVKLTFDKKMKYYILKSTDEDEFFEEQYPIFLNLEEHKMICSIVQELWEVNL